MKFATVLSAFMACSHAVYLPNPGDKGTMQKRADSDHAFSGTDYTRDRLALAAEPKDITRREEEAPLHYIVVFKKGEAESAYKAHVKRISKQVKELRNKGNLSAHVSDKVETFKVFNFVGYFSYLTPALLDDVQKDPIVDFIEGNKICHASEVAEQSGAPWGISRISQRVKKESWDYEYDNLAGKGVTAYVLDTGIKVKHPDFENRARWGPAIPAPHVKVDGHGHGTHVAGILGGNTYGVAKNVRLVAVQVFDETGMGPTSDIIKGVEYAVNDYQAQVKAKPKGYKGAVINLSLGAPGSNALDLVVNAAMDAGVHVVVAAGNEDKDACDFSPARATGPITVGATDMNDLKGNYSNYGKCVDVQAPGTDILSAGVEFLSLALTGTSMATPHVAGIIATFMSLQPNVGSEFNKDALVKPADLKRMFLRYSTRGVVKGLDEESPNRLAYNGAGLSLEDLWKF